MNCPNCRKWIILFSVACAVVFVQTIALTVLITQRGTANATASSVPNQSSSANSTSFEAPSELLLKYAGQGETSYLEAVLGQNPDLDVNRLRAAGNKTALYLACEKGYVDIVKILLARKADATICDTESGSLRDAMKYSSFTVAARNGHLDVIKTLISSGVALESKDDSGRTALWIASARNHASVVQFLCNAGAEVNRIGRNNMTALMVAMSDDSVEVVKVLLKYGRSVDLEQRDQRDRTLLYIAVEENKPELVRILCEANAKLNVYCCSSCTPLTTAAYRGFTEVVKALLKYGKVVDLEMRDRGYQGATPLYHAALSGNPETVDVLCKAGADLEARGNKFDKTPLEAASTQGHKDVITVLEKYEKKRQGEKRSQESSRKELDKLLK